MNVPSGQLRHRVMFERPNPDSPKDSAGQRLTQWLNVASDVAAKVEPINGRTAFIAAQRQASTTHTVTARWNPVLGTVDPSHRIVWGSRIFMIDRAENVEERNIKLVFECTEGLRTTS